MEGPIPGLDNREFSLLVWILLSIGAALLSRSIRRSLRGVLQSLSHWKLLLLFASTLIYLGLLILLLERLGLWTVGLVSETVYWTLFAGFVLLFKSVDAGKDEDFFKKVLLSSIAATALVEFFANLRPMILPFELILIPAVVILAGTAAVAGDSREHRQAGSILEIVARVIGLGVLAYTVVGLITSPEALLTLENLLEFLVPILMTLGLLPFLYGTALATTYGTLFTHLNWKLSDNRDVRRYAKRQVLRAAHVRLSRANRLSKGFHWKLSSGATRMDVDVALRAAIKAEEA